MNKPRLLVHASRSEAQAALSRASAVQRRWVRKEFKRARTAIFSATAEPTDWLVQKQLASLALIREVS